MEEEVVEETEETQPEPPNRSVPQAQEPANNDWPAEIDGEPLWEQGQWSGLDRYTCLWKVRHARDDGFYELPCRKDYWSRDDLMAHIRDDH